MGRVITLNREQPAARLFQPAAIQNSSRRSRLDLGREVEVLRGKLQSLKTAHERIEREIQKLSDEIEAAQAVDTGAGMA